METAMSPVGYFAMLYHVTGVLKQLDELEYAEAASNEVEPCALGLVHPRAVFSIKVAHHRRREQRVNTVAPATN